MGPQVSTTFHFCPCTAARSRSHSCMYFTIVEHFQFVVGDFLLLLFTVFRVRVLVLHNGFNVVSHTFSCCLFFCSGCLARNQWVDMIELKANISKLYDLMAH